MYDAFDNNFYKVKKTFYRTRVQMSLDNGGRSELCFCDEEISQRFA